MELFLFTVCILGILGLVGALVLWLTAEKFKVEEDPRIDLVEACLAGANCGGCGLAGCRAFAVKCVEQGSLDGLSCPSSGSDALARIASILGVEAPEEKMRNVAVVRCNGSCASRPRKYVYDGAQTCAIMDGAGVGTTGCSFGCLGCGDCVQACIFDAIIIDKATGLPVVDTDLCTGCGACVKECPRNIVELRPLGRRERRVWVGCSNRDKGAVARKECSAACIGCGKCMRTCPFGAISVSDNLAYVNPEMCRACGKCLPVCPTGAILASFEVKLPKAETNEQSQNI